LAGLSVPHRREACPGEYAMTAVPARAAHGGSRTHTLAVISRIAQLHRMRYSPHRYHPLSRAKTTTLLR
jgi:hypothetical protein